MSHSWSRGVTHHKETKGQDKTDHASRDRWPVDKSARPLNQTLEEVAFIIGRERALMLVGRLTATGSRPWRVCVYIPKGISPDHRLVRLVGWEDAQALCAHFRGSILELSSGQAIVWSWLQSEVRRLSNEGMGVMEIVDVLAMPARTVRAIRRRAEEAG